MIAYKFLASGGVSPFTGFRWPAAGEWVRAPSGRDDTWVHACRRGDLPHWLDDELWRIELDEPVHEASYQIASPRARLVARIAGWDGALRRAYARACALRARDVALPHLPAAVREALRGEDDLDTLARVAERGGPSHAAGYVADAARNALGVRPAATSYVACVLAAAVGGGLAAFEAERDWQARWLGDRLGLEPASDAAG